ncbi:MAG TPA: crossover junction endodeoxyribonuclease RuvC, partial [Casimicrobiaceae bacterium]|nr:crossover junction endodeoxyribonuclease RuvC [Casimicrobiaceae bacterium]
MNQIQIARRILGIDPGLRVTGFGIIICTGNRLQYVASGCIRNTSGELPDRLKLIVRDLATVIGA